MQEERSQEERWKKESDCRRRDCMRGDCRRRDHRSSLRTETLIKIIAEREGGGYKLRELERETRINAMAYLSSPQGNSTPGD